MKEVPFTREEKRDIAEKLEKSLGPEFLSTRAGPSGRLTYIEGKTAINIANDIFGFNGWSSDIKETVVDFVDISENGRVNIGISVTIRITLKDGTFHEDIGYGACENARTKAAAYEKARKQAVTDATKRTLRNFGNALGNCLYDKTYITNVGRMANPTIKFSPTNLYRHVQFDPKRREQLELEESRNKIRKLTDQHRHEQQVTLQNEKLSQNTSPVAANTTVVKETVISTAPVSQPSVKSENPEESKEVKEEFNPPLLLPEDSFSYEGDEEYFLAMIANQDYDPEVEAGLESQD